MGAEWRDRDIIIQKVLTRHATQEEKDWLLSQLMILYNEILILLSRRQYEKKEGGACAVHGL